MSEPSDFGAELTRYPVLRDFDAEATARLHRMSQELSEAVAGAQYARSAANIVDHIARELQRLEQELDDAQEIGVLLVSFSQGLRIHVREVTAREPNLIVFTGLTENGEPVTLVQHVSQLSFLVMKLPRLNPDEPRRPIGFFAETPTRNPQGS